MISVNGKGGKEEARLNAERVAIEFGSKGWELVSYAARYGSWAGSEYYDLASKHKK